MASLTYVGGTETYTENIQVQRSVSMQDNSNILTEDRQDEFWKDEYYYEGSSTALTDGFHLQFCNNTSEGMKFLSRHFTTDKIGTTITSKITFLKAFKNVQIPYVVWDNTIDGIDVTEENCTIKLNDTVITTLSVKKENFQEGVTSTIALNKTIGDIAIGDVISFEDSKSGTISDTSAYRDLLGGLRFDFSSDPVYFMETVPVQKTRGINKPVSSIYAGVTATVPKYTETTTTEDVALSANTFTDFFSADNTGTTGTNAKGITWADNSGGGLKLTFGNYGIDSSTSMTTFTAQRDLTNVVIKGLYYTETRYDKITLIVAGTTVLDAVSGTSSSLTQRWTGSLSKGQTIVLKYVKDNSQSASNESSTYFTLSCNPYQKTVTTQTQTGTETKLVDKKIVKGYVGGPDGKARLFFGENKPAISYSGEYEVFTYSLDGKPYDVYRLNTSGSLTCSKPIEYWACGGGASGWGGNNSSPYAGLGGASGFINAGPLEEGTYTITIGAGGTDEAQAGSDTIIAGDNTISVMGAKKGSFSGNVFNTNEVLGNSSGGGSYGVIAGYGYTNASAHKVTCSDWKNVFPFGIYDLKAHCAGGGGGGVAIDEDSTVDAGTYCYAGAGGAFGEPGKSHTGYSGGKYTSATPAKGGYYGGGDGGPSTVSAGKNATFYGSGGGGASFYSTVTSSSNTGFSSAIGGSGYQGACYLLVPSKKISTEKEMVKVILEGNDYLTTGYRTYLTVNENPNDNTTLVDSNKLGSISGSYYVPKNTQVDIWIFTGASSITSNLVSFNGNQSSAAARSNAYEIFSFVANKSYKISLTGPTTSSAKVTKVTITVV